MKNVVTLFFVLFLIVSCNQNKSNNYAVEDNIPFAFDPKATAGKMLGQAVVVNPQKKIQQKLIKTGSITFETKTLEITKKNLSNLIKQYKGYIANDNEYKSNDRISNTISVRIPTKSFDVFLEKISKGVKKFDSKNINISDVTEQFLDVELRLKNKKALENKYLEILKKAKNVREILNVERELGKLREDIEAFEGKLKYLQNQVSFSTLTITFYKKTAKSVSSFTGNISDAFKKSFENVKSSLVYLIQIWPFIIILFLLFFYIKRRIKIKKKS